MADAQFGPATLTVITDRETRAFVAERVYQAPQGLVFKTWTTTEALSHWWGPAGWTLPFCAVDFRPGGVWRYCMRGPEGEESWGKMVYRQIVEPERIVYLDCFSDAEGNVTEGKPQTETTVEFIEQDETTRLVSRVTFATVEQLGQTLEMGMIEGWSETADRRAEYLAGP